MSIRLQRTISSGLVAKWRAAGDERKRGRKVPVTTPSTVLRYVPSSRDVVQALVASLEAFGAFRGLADRRDVDKLFEHLGYEPDRPWGDVFQQVLQTAREDLHKDLGDPSVTFTKPELLLATACLVSQSSYAAGYDRLVKAGVDNERQRHFVFYVVFDAGDKKTFQDLPEQFLNDRRTRDFLRTLVADGIDTNVALGILHAEADDLGVSRERRAWGKQLAADSIKLYIRDAIPHLRDLCFHLYPHNSADGWMMMRHPEFYKKVRSNRASTIVSPLEEGEKNRLLELLGIYWTSSEQQWIVRPGELAEPSEGDREEQ
jgi:hypothetical protein